MKGCKVCGSCCKAIVMKADITQGLIDYCHNRGNDPEMTFLHKHFHKISLDEALTKRPDPYFREFLNLIGYPRTCNIWTCDALDYTTNRCSLHSERPSVCSGFPYYGDNEIRFAPYTRGCGYLEED